MRLLGGRMKAIYFEQHGGPEVIHYGNRPKPEPSSNQILIEVHAAGVNPRDWQFRDGTYAFRRLSGPLPLVPGSDVSGIVAARGKAVTDFEIGDEVFAMQTTLGRMGGYAEYMAVDSRVVAHKPTSISHVEAAALPVAGLTAWQALHGLAKMRAGTSVVVVGASGGVGHYAVQIAHHAGASVTAVCGSANVELVRELGADRVVDYTHHRFTEELRDQDLVFDTIGRDSLHTCAPALTRSGLYLTTNPTVQAVADTAVSRLRHPILGGRRAQLVLVRPNAGHLHSVASMVAEGLIRPAVEKTYPLEAAGEALIHSRTRRARGKLVLQVP
ncbi:NADP-dependent oxidoreductase [Rhodococcus sp. NPDC058521]|uniref:NADP-dependent oxidoreductase n=1 Tax=Rhodococcus sp. NPDC058521 TaxID=3346536 RepID=UPI0036641520